MIKLPLAILLIPILSVGAVSRTTDVQSLRQRLHETLQEALLSPARLEIDAPPIPPRVPGNARLVLQHAGPPLGMVRMAWEWYEGSELKRFATHAVVRGYSKVAVARRPLAQGTVFSSDDLQFVEKEVSRFGISGFYASWNDVHGLVASQYIRPGEALGAGNTTKPYEVSRGQLSEVMTQKGNIRISARVEALQNGRTGDWIQVKNPETHKVFRAQVTAAGQLRVE
ncbi:MAG: flagellar basal body P-ring formation protein FlgA [Bdellovibrionales bacterium]|nr:flagellar basal body P-ring formation protein FlgA [Bdellovibrionales bacterium]